MIDFNIKGIVYFLNGELKSTINGEIFKKTEYENYYISNIGRVVSVKDKNNNYRLYILKQHQSFGYLRVSIIDKGVKHLPLIHRLVAKAFIPNPNNYRVVNHKDENKHNNNVDNLEWCTDEYNMTYSQGQPIEQIDVNTKEVINTFDSIRVAARSLKIDFSAIRKCCINYKDYHKGLVINLHYYKGSYWRYKE